MVDKNQALTKADEPGAIVAMPEYVKPGDTRGHEGLERTDVVLPRLAVAQPTSPELQRGNPKFIPGLAAGDLFNTVSRKAYGPGPVKVVIVRREKPRAVEFNPIKDGGGIRDLRVPLTDPRCQFGPNGEPPVATVFREYVAILADTYEPIALSFKGTSLKTALALNTLLEEREVQRDAAGKVTGVGAVAYFARVYEISVALKTNEKGAFYVFGVQKVNGAWADPTSYRLAESTYEGLKGQTLAVDEDAISPDAPNAEKEPF